MFPPVFRMTDGMGDGAMVYQKMWVRGIAAATLALGAGTALANHSWGGYHWAKTGDAVQLHVGNNVSSAWDSYPNDYLTEALGRWNQTTVLYLFIDAGLTSPRTCKPVAGTIQVCNAAYGYTGWLGIAQIWLSGSHIAQAVTKLNDSYFNLSAYDTPAWRRLVMCQEIGHDFGLAHQDEAFDNANLGSCMDYSNDPDGTLSDPDQLSNESPNSHDYKQLLSIYNHIDSSGGGGGGKGRNRYGAGEDAGGNSPAEWGRAIHYNAEGKPDYFLQTLPSGQKKLTHVFWTPERARGHHH